MGQVKYTYQQPVVEEPKSESWPQWVYRQYNTPLIERLGGEELLKKMRNPTLSEVGPKGEIFPQRQEAAFYSGALEGLTKPRTIIDAATTLLSGGYAAVPA